MNFETSAGHSSFPRKRRAARGNRYGCKATILRNQRGSPWPDLVRPSTSSARRLSLSQDVDARDKPGQGALGCKIRWKTPTRAARQFSPDSPARGREPRTRGAGQLPPVQARGRLRSPAFEAVRKYEIHVIPGLGRSPRARNPRTQASANLGIARVHRFRAWSSGPSRNDEEVSAHQVNFLTVSCVGVTRTTLILLTPFSVGH